MFDFFILTLAVWRLAYMLVEEPGPGDRIQQFRKWLGVGVDVYSQRTGSNWVAKLFTCVWCMSVWVSLVFVIIRLFVQDKDKFRTVILPLALSAGAIIIHSHTE